MRQHQDSVSQVLGVISLVVSAATSLRGAGRVFGVLQEWAGVLPASPSWSSPRLWLLRVGYSKLTRAKEQAGDWVWRVDHGVQRGQEKCVLIVGLRLSALPGAGDYLPHADVEPIALCPVTEANGEILYQQ